MKKSRRVSTDLGMLAATEGATGRVCLGYGIPPLWADRCEDASHSGPNGTSDELTRRLAHHLETSAIKNFDEKLAQLGSYGGGNHFGEANVVSIEQNESAKHAARVFGLLDDHVSFLSHCGSRGFGNVLATNQFRFLLEQFTREGRALPGNDRELVYAPLGTPEADAYLEDMALGGNFATVNHLLINSLVLEAFQEVIPGTRGELVYFISHNIARREIIDGKAMWVHRKGATRAYPAGHDTLVGTPFATTGHPILLPGNPVAGSAIMVAEPGARLSCFSVNHGAGRALGRKAAMRSLDQNAIDLELDRHDILSNCRIYPKDEAPAAYKDFAEVLRSVEVAGLAKTIARLKARFVIKDGDLSLKGAG